MHYQKETTNSVRKYNFSTKNGTEDSTPRGNRITFTSRNTIMSIMVGIIAGLLISQFCIFTLKKFSIYFQYDMISIYHSYEENRASNEKKIDFESHYHYNENKTIADKLFNEVSILCWVMTNPKNNNNYPQKIKETWGQRCNKLIFMSSEKYTKLGEDELPVSEGRHNLWGKTKEAFKYIHQYHLNEYDWFLKADDHTYVVMENLRKLLFAYNGEYPICLGCKFEIAAKQEDIPAAKGLVLNRKAVKNFVENALHDRNKCRQESDGDENIELVKCLKNVQVIAGDSPDKHESGIMIPAAKRGHFNRDVLNIDVPSDNIIYLHSLKPGYMLVMEYLIYHLRPLGIIPAPDILPDKISLDEIMNETSRNNNSNVLAY